MEKIIVDEDIYLSPVTPADNDNLVKYIGDYDVYENLLTVPHPYSTKDAEWWINLSAERTKKHGRPINWCIRKMDGKLIGSIGQHIKYDGDLTKDEIGYWLAKPFWRRGIMTKVIRVYCNYLFLNTRLERIEAPVFARNIGSAKVLEKCGFTFEGIIKDVYEKEGETLDGKMYVLVK